MNRHPRLWLTLITSVVISSTAFADEGMWPLYMLQKLPWDTLSARGLQLKPEEIYNSDGTGLANAVVQLGATGSFVSPNGLLLTNHHVAFGAIQEQSTLEHNYVRDGFYAATTGEELPALGYKAYATLSIQDVTERILAGVGAGTGDLERYQVIDKATKELIKETEAIGNVKARVAKMSGGRQYVLYTMLELRDIRIVQIPPEAIGNYGDDIDNWMWPRHCGDFSFLRAYVAPDGKPADYSVENVPYHPKAYLSISTEGIREGDFTMTLGFPGNTSRYISSYELANQININYPNSIRTLEDQIRIVGDAGTKDSTTELRMASRMAGLSNSLKKSYGIMDGFKKRNILAYKRDKEQQLTAFLLTNATLQKQFGGVLPALDSLYRAREQYQARDFVLGRMSYGCDYLRLSSTIYRWACERQKPDLERERGYQDRDTLAAKERLKNAQINLEPKVDRQLLAYFIGRAQALPVNQKIAAMDQFAGATAGNLDRLIDGLYTHTKVGDSARRLAMFAMSKSELEQLNDPFINLAKALKPELDEQLERGKVFDGAQMRLAPRLIEAYASWQNGNMYPDANGTMRLSYGEVKGYSPHDAVSCFYQTGLEGVMEKETGRNPFTVPAELAKARNEKNFGAYRDPLINDIPVDFITTNDITGGNSGSPVLNGKGKMIGLAFDGNWEGVASDYLFNPPVTRTIAVDIRYVMFLIDRVYNFKNLVTELTTASRVGL